MNNSHMGLIWIKYDWCNRFVFNRSVIMNTSRMAGLFLLAGLISILLAACAPSVSVSIPTFMQSPTSLPLPMQVVGLVTQAKDIVGIWQVFDSHCAKGFMLIRTDGTYTWSCNQDGSDGTSGTYWFENQHFLIKNDFCGATGQYEAQIVQEKDQSKSLIFTLIKDDCESEISTLTQQPAIWVAALP
jgi:hypothetical protein